MEKLLLSVGEACEATGLGRSKLLELAYRGTITSVVVGRRRLFPASGLKAWAERLAQEEPVTAGKAQ